MSNDKIIKLVTTNTPSEDKGPEPLNGLVEVLEDMLERAKSGKLRSIAFAAQTSEGECMRGKYTTYETSVFELLGIVTALGGYILRTEIDQAPVTEKV